MAPRLGAGRTLIVGAAAVAVACSLDLRGREDGVDARGGADAALADSAQEASSGYADAAASPDCFVGDAGLADEAVDSAPADEVGIASLDAACPGVTCNGQCSPDTDCRACTDAPLLCRATNTCAADCSACPAMPVACFACDAMRVNPIGACQANDPAQYCLSSNYNGIYADASNGAHCLCNAATDCPGEEQVCIFYLPAAHNTCFSCGEGAVTTQNAACKNGQTCNAPQRTCN